MTEERRPALMYIYQPQNHEPLDDEGRAWLADQLCSDTRVHPDRTMSIGWITTQAAYEYPALHDALATTRAELAAKDAEIARLQMRLDGLQSLLRDALHYVTKCADMDLADAISCMMVIEHELRAPYNAPECPVSHDGRHHVDTSMESGPNNCFHCEAYMSGKGV